MKKRLLFIVQIMNCGGVEKALLNTLKLIDKEKYECEILTIFKEGKYLQFIPEEIKVLEYCAPDYIKTMIKGYDKPRFSEEHNFLKRIYWIFYYYLNKVYLKFFNKNLIFKKIYKRMHKNNIFDNYDAIIDFHGYGCFTTYIAAYEKGEMKRISWIHEQNIYWEYELISSCYGKFDHIFACAQDCRDNFIKKFPQYKNKISIYYNYLDINEIKRKADLFVPDEFNDTNNKLKIVSVGRVDGQKAFNRVVKVAKILKSKGYKFYWIVVGDGSQLDGLRKSVTDENLESYVNFIGYRSNPYVYIKNADLYVQTSVAEGFCTTISEAIVLGKAVVTTDVSGANEQLDNSTCGIIVSHSVEDISDAIKKLIEDKELLDSLSMNSRNKNMDFSQEIKKLYKVCM